MESLCYVQVVTPDFIKYNLAWQAIAMHNVAVND